ncbi:MAG: DUF882 domain-containing protein [Hyphomicrobiaceae bacterium]
MFSRRWRLVASAAIASLVLTTCVVGQVRAESGDRTISIYNIHTKETLTVTFKHNGKYIPDALKKLNHIMRDYRRNEETHMDPALFDLLWKIHKELGSKEPIHLISGYRSRKTNEMLRRTRGGQAKQSRHVLGKASDVYFPDVPLKMLRYSALIEEQGGVGYYPTSAIPFVHIDTDRVRSWPRLPRQELALLFPSGHTQHMPASGGAITARDVQIARVKNKPLAVQIAAFREELRHGSASFAVAQARHERSTRTERVALLPNGLQPVEPSLVEQPKPAIMPANLVAPMGPGAGDRARLAELSGLASIGAIPKLVRGPQLADRHGYRRSMDGLASSGLPPPPGVMRALPGDRRNGQRLASIDGNALAGSSLSDVNRFNWGGWISAPAYDDEHPEELSYRPFPITPFMTQNPDDPIMQQFEAHDAAYTVEILDQPDSAPVLRFRPNQAVASLMWAQQFTGKAIGIDKLRAAQAEGAIIPNMRLRSHPVRTSRR